jgi:hypothetical protein
MNRLAGALLVLFAALLFAISGCGGGDDDGGDGTATPSPESPSPRTATPTAGPPTRQPFGGSTDMLVVPHEVTGAAILRNVTISEQEGFDRLVMQFDGGLPGYRIQYVDPPIILGPSGLEAEISGEAFLEIRMEPAAAHDPNTGAPTFEPLEFTPVLPAIVEAERTEDFEGVLIWVLGQTGKQPFRVDEQNAPYQLTIDVAHP